MMGEALISCASHPNKYFQNFCTTVCYCMCLPLVVWKTVINAYCVCACVYGERMGGEKIFVDKANLSSLMRMNRSWM